MTAAQERRRALEKRLGLSKSHGAMLSIVLFGFTMLVIGAIFRLFKVFSLPSGWLAAIVCIALAELLIRRFRFVGTGVESALWLGGLFAWIAGLRSEGKPEALLLFAAAAAIAGGRVRNAFFGGLAAVFVISYLGAKHWYVAALLAGVLMAAAALAALVREWPRPSTETLFIVLLLVSPVAGAAWSIEKTSLFWAFLYIALMTAEIAVGVRMRHRGALFGSAVSIVIAVVVLRELFAFALEWKMIAAGALMFLVSAVVSAALRGRTRGFVMTPVKSAYEEALRVFGSAAFAPRVEPAATAQPIGGGGNFGGAGASGDY